MVGTGGERKRNKNHIKAVYSYLKLSGGGESKLFLRKQRSLSWMGCHPQKQLHSWHHRLVMINASYTLLSQVIVHSPVLRLLWGASPHFWRGPYSPRKNETPCQVMKMAILGFSSVDTSYLGSSAVAMHPVTHNEAQPPPPPLGIMPSHISQGKAALLLSSPTLHRPAAVAIIAPTSKVLQPLPQQLLSGTIYPCPGIVCVVWHSPWGRHSLNIYSQQIENQQQIKVTIHLSPTWWMNELIGVTYKSRNDSKIYAPLKTST